MPDSQTRVRTETLAIGVLQRILFVLIAAMAVAASGAILLSAQSFLLRATTFPF